MGCSYKNASYKNTTSIVQIIFIRKNKIFHNLTIKFYMINSVIILKHHSHTRALKIVSYTIILSIFHIHFSFFLLYVYTIVASIDCPFSIESFFIY